MKLVFQQADTDFSGSLRCDAQRVPRRALGRKRMCVHVLTVWCLCSSFDEFCGIYSQVMFEKAKQGFSFSDWRTAKK